MTITTINTARTYELGRTFSFLPNGSQVYSDGVTYRWIGKCKRCSARHKLEGALASAHRGSQGSTVIVTPEGAYDVGCLGSDTSHVTIRCGDHWVNLWRVREGRKHSKHECNARCLASTGPNCDCRCKGANHGSSL